MAPNAFGGAGPAGHHGFANGLSNGGPPPSTLAAQLVENISTSTRSSRPDETSELKRLFSVIEKIKNEPESLKTTEERVEHNHMLIYVYARCVLDNLKWDDVFGDHNQVRAEALKAVEFLKVTIKETPSVLNAVTDGQTFLYHGSEPLWVWLFPKVLKMLGHPHCVALTPALEGFFQFILFTASNSGGLWNTCDLLYRYLQANFRATLSHLKSILSANKRSTELDLPSHNLIGLLLDSPSLVNLEGCSFGIFDTSHALRHASSLLTILHTAALPGTSLSSPAAATFSRHIPWLIDSMETLSQEQQRWRQHYEVSPALILQHALNLSSTSSGMEKIVSEKIHALIVILCGDMAEHPKELIDDDYNGKATRQTVCLALVHIAEVALKYKSISRLAAAQLLNPLDRLFGESAVVGETADFERCVQLLREAVASPVLLPFSAEVLPNKFLDPELQSKVRTINTKVEPAQEQGRAAKRRKITQESSALPVVMNRLCRILERPNTSKLADLEEHILHRFSDMGDVHRCMVIDLLARLACAADGTLILAGNGQAQLRCSFCSQQEVKTLQPDCREIGVKSLAGTIFKNLIRLPSFSELRRPRVIAMIALRRLITHSKDPRILHVEKSELSQFCLPSLQSSLRELRIAASRSLALFLRPGVGREVGSDILNQNTTIVFNVLKSLSDKNVTHLNETCLMAWGQVGRVVADDELNLVLVKMLDFLGHRNTIVSAFAFNEILNLANFRRVTPRRLLEPFWGSIAFTAVKDMITRPQTTRMIADLLKTSVTELLLLTQTHALPWLVLHKKRDVIQKIAEARGETEIWRPCLDDANASKIMALLLVQEVPDVEEFAMSLLRHVSEHFSESNFGEILSTQAVLIVLELLKIGGEADEARRALVRAALTKMATSLKLPSAHDGRKKGHHVIGRFLQQHALGLTTRMVEDINDSYATHPPVQEQKRCIKAMEEMVVLCKDYIRIARPQISVCLLSALSYDELRSTAFSCWVAMLTHLEEEDVEALIETTFFIIGHYWASFDETTRKKSETLLTFLLGKHSTALKNTANKLPSLRHIAELGEFNKTLDDCRKPLDNRAAFALFSERLCHENSGVVQLALSELSIYLRQNQGYLQASAISEQPDSVVTSLSRSLLDCSSKYSGVQSDVARLCAECIGLVGCLDSNRLETVREQRHFVVLHNFDDAGETTDFALFILHEVLVKSFLSTADTSLQGYLSYAMQELLERCDFKTAVAMQGREGQEIYRKWLSLPESVREVLTPFMSSCYRLAAMPQTKTEYPIFRTGKSYANWIRQLTLDLLRKGQNPFAQIIFEPLCRAIRVKDLSVAVFLLPYLVVHITIGQESTPAERNAVWNELLSILQYEPPENASHMEREDRKLFCEAVFRVLDYAMRWLQLRKASPRTSRTDEIKMQQIQVKLNAMPAELVTQRAIDCKQYARALFHLEPHIVHQKEKGDADAEDDRRALDTLQHIYAQIDEPDGLEGVSANLKVIDLNQQILSHRKAGRWTRAQTWYEVQLAEDPNNVDVQLNLLTCLKESGQYDVLLNYVEGMTTTQTTINRIAPFAVEASWATGRWQTLHKYLQSYNASNPVEVFNLGIGSALLSLKDGQIENFTSCIQELREKTVSSMSHSATSSLQASHEAMLKCHVLADLDLIAENCDKDEVYQQTTLTTLDRRLEVLGAYVNDKQYVLGIRRAAMELMRPKFTDGDISSLWLSSARLARKASSLHQSFNAVLHASQLGDGSATIENARLLWKEGHHRKAIQILENAIQTDSFIGYNLGPAVPTSSKSPETQRNLLTARAHLLLAKWQDSAGQTHAGALRLQYQLAAKVYPQWEKGHFFLGRHYKKVMESEKTLKPNEQSDEYLTGETAKLVIENYLRSLNFGTKYLYQTLPRILTLWLDLGAQVDKAPVGMGKVSVSDELYQRRKKLLHELHKYFYKHMQKMPAYIFYTAMPQVVARIAHPNEDVFKYLEQIIIKVVEAYPQQSLWGLFAIMTTKAPSERKQRGAKLLNSLRATRKVEGAGCDLKNLLRTGEKLADQLLLACNNGDFQSNRTTHASITRDLNFNHKCTPCLLVVPIEACLTATLPTLTDNMKKHKAFSRDVITVESFLDDVLVLGSLAKPRRLTARGSDGKSYNLLIKPKDDLRTDQRLMEFNSMINRSLKRDAECSRRQLYIKTYAVTPLNEECGIIEWVDGLKTLRDILLGLYKSRGIAPNYGQIGQMMKEACISEKNTTIFSEQVLGMFPPVLSYWFIGQFPNPSAWFAARLKYTRSCAVMSMVGTILGLGDRHGENVLLEEGNGGVFHVDFNCLFDKGLTFAQPERVPFRLTHNMVAAMGIYGYEGPFRQCSELTLSILRQQEETLMTILEAFIYDPTLDLQKDKKRKSDIVRLNPQSVVDSIKRKVRGLLPDESIPLGVEGQVEELIKQATNPRNLSAMYIGWCPFL